MAKGDRLMAKECDNCRDHSGTVARLENIDDNLSTMWKKHDDLVDRVSSLEGDRKSLMLLGGLFMFLAPTLNKLISKVVSL